MIELARKELEVKPYWLVHHVDGGYPRVKHSTKESAVAEAKRLAAENPGRVFTVLEPVSAWTSPHNVIEVEIAR